MKNEKQIGEMHSDIKNLSKTMDKTLEQARLTNGRVTKLEASYNTLRGVMMALGFFAGVGGVPALITFLSGQ